MAEGEGKPAISLLEEQEQQKRRPAAPSQTPAPYVQPYRPAQVVPPIARQVNISGNGAAATAENLLRNTLSNASYGQQRPLGNVHSGSTFGPGLPGAGSVASGGASLADGIPGTFNHNQISYLLTYTQQQLTQLQHVQALLFQHLQSLHQLQGAGGSNVPGAIPQGPPVVPPGLSSLLGSATGTGSPMHAARADGPTATAAGALPTHIANLARPPGIGSGPGSLPSPDRSPTQSPHDSAVLGTGPRPPSRLGTAVLQPPRPGTSSPPAAWPPPRPPSRSVLKEHSSLGVTASPGTPTPGSPESAGTSSVGSPPQPQAALASMQGVPQGPSQPAGAAQPTSERLAPPSDPQQPSQQGAQAQVQAGSSGSGSPPAAVGSGGGRTSSGSQVPEACTELAPLDGGSGSVHSLTSHPLAGTEPTAAVQATGGGTRVIGAQVPPHGALAASMRWSVAAVGSGSPPLPQVSGATVAEGAGPLPVGSLASPFATPAPSVPPLGVAPVQLGEMRPLDVVSLSLGLQPLPQGLPLEPVPPPSVIESALVASALTGPALQGLTALGTGLVLQHPLAPSLPVGVPGAAEPMRGGSVGVLSLQAPLSPQPPQPLVATAADLAQQQAFDASAAAAAAEAGAAAEAAAKQANKPEPVGPPGPELDAQLDANRKDLMVFPEDEDDGDDEEMVAIKRKRWYEHTGLIWFFGSAFVGMALTVTGICLQTGKINKKAAEAEVFRWLYFVAGYVPIYWTIYFVVSRIFMLTEWIYFRENLTYLTNIKKNTTALAAMLFQLLWFQACFAWLWCDKGRCASSTYIAARDATWKAVLCMMLFTLANVIKAVTAKVSSMHFYRTAHFKKLKDSLEKEYYLQLLSVPRSRILAAMQAAQAPQHDSAKHRLRTALARRSLLPGASLTLQRLSRPTPLFRATNPAAAAGGGGGDGDGGEVHGGKGGGGDEVHGGKGGGGDAEAVSGVCNKEKLQSIVSGGSGLNATVGPSGSGGIGNVSLSGVRELGCNSTGGAPCTSWVGFWTCGPGHRRADSDNPGWHSQQRSSQAARGDSGVGGGGSNGPRHGSPPRWSANVLGGTSTVSSSSPGPHSICAPGGSGGVGDGSNGAEHAIGNGGQVPSPGDVTLVVMADVNSPRHGQQPPPPPPAAPPAPPPPPPPLPAQSVGSGVDRSLRPGGALGVVTAEPFLTQTSAYFDNSHAQEQQVPQQQQPPQTPTPPQQQQQLPREVQGSQQRVSHGSQAQFVGQDPAEPSTQSGSNRGFVPAQLVRLISRVMGGLTGSNSGRPVEPGVEPAKTTVEGSSQRGGAAAQPKATFVRTPSKHNSFAPPQRLRSMGKGNPPHLKRRLAELGAEAFNVVPLDIKRKKAVQNMTETELEKVRDAIVIKTYTALIRKHSGMSEEEQLRELRTVKRFAKALYFNIRGPDASKTFLTMDDFKLFFGDDEEMARKAFEVFDADKDGKLTRSEVRDRVVSIYAERRNMARSLRDTDSIVRSLELSLGIAVHFLFGAIYLTIWGVPLLEGFSAFSATVLALTFIFGNSAKNAFESVLFLFFEHPYDVGDMVYFNGDSMRVKRISLMYTDFVKWTNEEVYVPNAKMLTTDVTNWTRTRTKFELHKILVDVGVPWEVKEDITNALAAHCNAHPNDFVGTPRVTFREVMDPMKVYLGIGFTYNFPPDDFDRLVPARDKIMYVVQSKLAEHKLVFSNHQINRLQASEEIRMAMQLRELRNMQNPVDSLLDDLMAAPPQAPPEAADGTGAVDAAAQPAAGAGLSPAGGPPATLAGRPGARQPSDGAPRPVSGALAALGGRGATTSSALPAFGAEGLQHRSSAVAVAAAAPTGGAADGAPAGDEQARKSKKTD